MIVGIIGKGKMGRDIFNYIFQYEHKLVLICRKPEEIDEIKASIEKQLNKMLKRGYLDATSYEAKVNAFNVSNSLTALKDCDLVIESVNEDRALKQDIFKMVEAIVRPDCIMATNTSSIPLEQVFEKCTKKDRCLGMHFFYPVKITNFVEVNKTKLTDQFFVEKVKDLLVSVEKKYLELNHEVNLLPTKLYTLFTTEIYNIYEENYLPIEEIDEIVKSNLIIFGVFEIIDSTGVNIIMECLENFMNPRYKGTFTLLYNKCKKLLLEGYSGGTTGKGISAYEIENPRVINEITDIEKNEYKNNVILRLQSLLINEMIYVIKNNDIEAHSLNKAIQEVFGLSEDPLGMLHRIGAEKITACLRDCHIKSNDDIYKPEDLFSIDKLLNQ